MDVKEVQAKLIEFEADLLREVQRFNDLTGTVISINLSYIENRPISGRPYYVPVVTTTSKIR